MNNNRIAYIALGFVCVVWGTTYLALLIGVRHFPAFLFTGLRQFTAGLILASFMLLVRKKELGGKRLAANADGLYDDYHR